MPAGVPGYTSTMMRRFRLPLALLVTSLLWPAPRPGGAVESVVFELDALEGDGWRLAGGRLALSLSGTSASLRVDVPGPEWDGEPGPVESLEAYCAEVFVGPEYVACAQGSAAIALAGAEAPLESDMSFVLRRADGAWRAQGDLRLGAEAVDWAVTGDADGLRATLGAPALPAGAVAQWLPWLPEWLVSPTGRIEGLAIAMDMPRAGPSSVRLEAGGSGLGFDSSDGSVAAAGVGLRLKLDGEWSPDGWRVVMDVRLHGGELLAGPFYTRLGDEVVTGLARLRGAGATVHVDEVRLDDPGVLRVAGSGRWEGGSESPLAALRVERFEAAFPVAFERYVQSVLAHYGFGGLDVTGALRGSLSWQSGALEAFEVELEGVNLGDDRGRLEATDVGGAVRWQARGEALASRLAWNSAGIYRIPLGAVDLRAESSGDSLRLTRETQIPVLDGTLAISELMVRDWLGEQPELLFDARIDAISLARLSEALEWPPLAGTLSGRIPALTYGEGVYRLGGALDFSVFDGNLRVDNLRVERPFGVLPKLEADVELRNLDLEQVTGTFEFGRIQGRLEGHLRQLRLLAWQPVHFIGQFRTPARDDSRHRISQRAVDTLTSIGGGASGALSRSFLKFFDDFGYRQLGLSCRLQNNVCHMEGVAPAPGGGYYIVQGSGVPRVDVIGHVRRVDWPRLVSQLIQATQGRPPVVGGRPET